jgi:hypothetical protein
MYRRGETHLQPPLRSSLDELPERERGDLEESWAATFYREFFSRIDEDVFAVLYSDKPSRPNVAINRLVAFEVLKAGHGWSDAEAYDAARFNVQVRFAMGLYDLSEEIFTLRTVYNFRRAMAEWMARTGDNLFEQVFTQVTGEQLKAFELRSTRLRMDSTQVASNIRNMSRLQLLVEVLQRVHRMMDEADRARYAKEMAEYIGGSAGQYAYHMRGDEPREHLDRIGRFMQRLVAELQGTYSNHETYGVLSRVLHEQFAIAEPFLIRRHNEDVSAQSLQSPDDPEATYRTKGREGHRGYVANLTETCDSENDTQLIVHVAVEPNAADDARMLEDAVPQLVEMTDVRELYTDGGYNSAAVDVQLRERGIEQFQTAIRGKPRGADRLGREDFDWTVDDKSGPLAVTCPKGETGTIRTGRQAGTFIAAFRDEVCCNCPLQSQCPVTRLRRKPLRVLRFSQRQLDSARRVRRSRDLNLLSANPRAAIEATAWSVTCRFPRGKVPFRRRPRIAAYIFARSMMINVKRLARHLKGQATGPQMPPGNQSSSPTRPLRPSFHLQVALRRMAAALRLPIVRPHTNL